MGLSACGRRIKGKKVEKEVGKNRENGWVNRGTSPWWDGGKGRGNSVGYL